MSPIRARPSRFGRGICALLKTTHNGDVRLGSDEASSRLSSFCDALIQAVTLAIIWVVPILRRAHAACQPFNFDFLRTVDFIGLVPWLARATEQRNLVMDFRSHTGRAFGTAGHPIYLASYLLMWVPLTIYRIAILWREGPRATIAIRRLARIVFAMFLATQLAAVE